MMLNTGVRDSVAAAGKPKAVEVSLPKKSAVFPVMVMETGRLEVGLPLPESALKTIGQLTLFPKQTTHTLPNPPVSVPGVSGPQTGAAIQSWPRR
jgi:hypothetical protein